MLAPDQKASGLSDFVSARFAFDSNHYAGRRFPAFIGEVIVQDLVR
jgi:hypothetical protein